MDTATAAVFAKGAVVFIGVMVFLHLLVKEYQCMAESMAGKIARAALDRARKERGETPQPRLTLSPAGDANQPSAT